jgi:uncharacterized membrane protein HdeD (DUF308 family)
MTFWVTLLRGVFALVLGVAILAVPEKSSPLLANFMGLYWTTAGILNLTELRAGRLRNRLLGGAAGWIAVAVGAAVLTYSLALGREASTVIVASLGMVILLTGVIHLAGGFEHTDTMGLKLRPGLVIGAIEVVLGALLVASPTYRPDVFAWIIGAWALAAGATLGAQAFHDRTRRVPE